MITFDRNHNAVHRFRAYGLSARPVVGDSDILVLYTDTRPDRCDFICYRLHRCVRLHGAVRAVDFVSSRRNQCDRDLTASPRKRRGIRAYSNNPCVTKLFFETVKDCSMPPDRSAIQTSV